MYMTSEQRSKFDFNFGQSHSNLVQVSPTFLTILVLDGSVRVERVRTNQWTPLSNSEKFFLELSLSSADVAFG